MTAYPYLLVSLLPSTPLSKNLKLTSLSFLYVLVFFSYIKNFPAKVFILSAGLILIVISDILVDLLLSLFLFLNFPSLQSVI